MLLLAALWLRAGIRVDSDTSSSSVAFTSYVLLKPTAVLG